MRLNILIGGTAGQGINKVSEILSKVLTGYGYFTFNYRDYQSLIRGGHNFNILSLSDKWMASHESKMDFLVSLDDKTVSYHKDKIKKDTIILTHEKFEKYGRNLNVALAGALIKILGIKKEYLLDEIKRELENEEAIKSAEEGYNSQTERYHLEKQNNKIAILTGSKASAIGAKNSGLDLYICYPMTPATGLMNELANFEGSEKKPLVFQSESEVGAVNQALGASFAGALTMTGTSGGGFDLMTEGLSMQGQSGIPLTVYLASRPGPSTGIPTYTAQDDLEVALRGGHGEFPRIVVAPGDPLECIEKTNEALYLAEKYRTLSIILTDKHLAESEYSINKKANKIIPIKTKRKMPGKDFIKTSSYDHSLDSFAISNESANIAEENNLLKITKYNQIKKEIESLEPIKLYGKKSKNLIIAWGSTKGAILDAIRELDCQFLQVIYLKPMSTKIKKLIENKNLILIEQNITGQLGRLIREKTGMLIPEKNRILKHDGRPFTSDELEKEIRRRLK
jgi:2-oxoglutarate/2-oxoacid ferredoxin oxidoreductase subunit alpha